MISMADLPIQRLSIFNGLDEQQTLQLAGLLEICRFPEDCTIFEQGQEADFVYIALKGEVLIRYKPYDGPTLTVARILPDGIFGWSAVIGTPIYTSAAITTIASEVYRISGQKLQALCSQYPETGVIIIERLASVVAERLSIMHDHIRRILNNGIGQNNHNDRRTK